MQYYVNMHVSEHEGLNMYSDIHYIMSDVILLHHEWLRAGLTLTGLDKDYLGTSHQEPAAHRIYQYEVPDPFH